MLNNKPANTFYVEYVCKPSAAFICYLAHIEAFILILMMLKHCTIKCTNILHCHNKWMVVIVIIGSLKIPLLILRNYWC